MTKERKYKCIVVDDEPIARKILVAYVEELPMLINAGQHKNALEALSHLTSEPDIDFIFTDINMPNLSGLSLVEILKSQQQIVFTTAYSEFAVESYNLDAADYLLKPFSFERFSTAVMKCIERVKYYKGEQPGVQTAVDDRLFYIKSGTTNFPVIPREILFCEAMRNYTKVLLSNGQSLMPLVNLSKFEDDLKEVSASFVRVHRSFIINRQLITAVKASSVLVNGYEVPIGNQYKDSFFQLIGIT